ncbi:MAG TPA: hypothetical protein VK635_15360, partial [Bradyrhizobium sp.]|nr:hypothetical protein [Bradyrhizobium sp.]
VIRAENAFTPRSSRYLNYPSNFIGHGHPNKPANGERMIRQGVGGLAIRSGASHHGRAGRTHNRIPLLLTARWITGRFLQLDGSRAREGRGKNQTKIKKEMSDVSGTH